MDIIETIDHFGSSRPDTLCHVWQGGSMTYSQLKIRSHRLAAHIVGISGSDRTPVIVYGHKESEMLVCFLACVKAGHAYIPIDSSLPADRIRNIADSAGAKLMLCVQQPNESFGDTRQLSACALQSIFETEAPSPDPSLRVKDGDVFYIIYTSGSTGKPKGVQISLHNLQSFIDWAKDLGGLPEVSQYRFINTAPFSFDLSVMDLYLSLYLGGTLYTVDRSQTQRSADLFDFLKKSDATAFVCTPSFADLCLADASFGQEMLPHLRCFLFCGETLTNRTAAQLLQRFPQTKVVNLYGPTEATVSVTAVDIDQTICDTVSPLPVGVMKDDCELLILGPDGKPARSGEHGEIAIAGESVSIGYYKNPEMTARSFFDWRGRRAYRTGDEGYEIGGMLHYCGRLDFQIKLHGYRIEIEDIENNLRRLDDISGAVVVPSFENGIVTHLTAFLIPKDKNADRSLKATVERKKKLRKLLPDYMVPKKIIYKDAFPMSPNGKIDRKALASEVK